ncbi:MAG TPA: nucleotidyltransferase domain-containing protein [Candidatus Scatovivens faecipullorum]|nr:nucleotidyltransferase domain-containing protein [Candidatus Scatovivens faecipullorum]
MMKKMLKDIKQWAENEKQVESIIVVGSYARGTYKKTSDIDLVIITSNKKEMLKNQNFIKVFGDVNKSQIEYYGACTSIRVWYKDGKEVEFGIVNPTWIEKPLDNGTNKVLSDGFKVIIDKKDYFKDLRIM